MLARGQIEKIRFLTAEPFGLPAQRIGKGQAAAFRKGHFAVDAQPPLGGRALRYLLPEPAADLIIAVLRDGDRPFDPLAGGAPVLAADRVQPYAVRVRRLGRRIGAVIHRMQHLIGFKRRLLPLHRIHQATSGRTDALRSDISGLAFRRTQLQRADSHRFTAEREGKGMLTCGKIKLPGVGIQAVRTAEQHRLPPQYLALGGLYLVAAAVPRDFAVLQLIPPEAGQRQRFAAGKRGLPVHHKRQGNRAASALPCVVGHRQAVPPRLCYRHRPGDRTGSIIPQHRFVRAVPTVCQRDPRLLVGLPRRQRHGHRPGARGLVGVERPVLIIAA